MTVYKTIVLYIKLNRLIQLNDFGTNQRIKHYLFYHTNSEHTWGVWWCPV